MRRKRCPRSSVRDRLSQFFKNRVPGAALWPCALEVLPSRAIQAVKFPPFAPIP